MKFKNVLAQILFASLVIACPSINGAENDSGHAGAVILIVDGLGAAYTYPEYTPYASDGSIVGKAVLFNLTGVGARILDMRSRVPETLKSHSILVTGSEKAEPESLGRTVFDVAREKGYLSLAILQHGDFREMLARQDGALYFGNNSIYSAKASLCARKTLPQDLHGALEKWRDAFPNYTSGRGPDAYIGYDRWGLDAATDLVENIGNRSFILIVNVGAVDGAGQNLGQKGYLETVQALDMPLGRLEEICRRHNVLLAVTADHGMSFPDEKGKGGHSAPKYSDRIESLRIPMVVFGPDVDELNLGGIWFEEEIAPTILDLLDLPQNLSSARPLPLKDSYDLRVINAPGKVSLYRGEELVANASADNGYIFKGLKRGLYTLACGSSSSSKSLDVCINGDRVVDLSDTSGRTSSFDLRKILGIMLIVAINLTGILLIIRIIRKDKK